MRIAFLTNDREHISGHFGRCKGFLIFEIQDGNIVKEEYIPNTITGHAPHTHNDKSTQEHLHNHSTDTHNRVVQEFANIDVVISGGMGYGMRSRFESAGIKTIFTSEKKIKTALDLFLQGNLKNEENLTCNHKH